MASPRAQADFELRTGSSFFHHEIECVMCEGCYLYDMFGEVYPLILRLLLVVGYQ